MSSDDFRPRGLARESAAFPPLGGSAWPVAQDRFERLVSTVTVPEPPEAVWTALTDPDRVAHWLAVCRGPWAVAGRESMLDFEDGEFFWCRTLTATAPRAQRPGTLRLLWRWVGVGPATAVTWTVAADPAGSVVTVVEEADNPPSDWRSWNGMGWPGILDQLAAHLRTGTSWRWPWRRVGPYLQIPLPVPAYRAWQELTSPAGVQHWLQRMTGTLAAGEDLVLVMGDASGTVQMHVTRSVEAAQEFPSYLPYLEFELRRPAWDAALGGRLWIEPAGLETSLLQVCHFGWENLDIPDPLTERRILTGYWTAAADRARALFLPQGPPAGPHGWSMAAAAPAMPAGAAPAMPAGAQDPSAVAQFLGRVTDDLATAMAGVLCALGVRLGLFAALGTAGPATATELADRTGLSQRHLREWLRGLTSAGYLEHDRGHDRYALPPAHAAVLAFEDSPLHLAPGFALIPPLAAAVEDVADDFRTGKGLERSAYSEQLFTAMEHMSATWLEQQLTEQWIPAVPGLLPALEQGGAVADIGCGGGLALIRLARRFPACRLTGYDLHEPNVRRAREAVREADLADRVTVAAADAATALADAGPLRLVTLFDVLHDAAAPEDLLRTVRSALEPDGVLLVLESPAADDPADNAGPQATVLYATSTLYCLPTALADGAPGHGTLGLPPSQIHRLAGEAGFGRVEEVPTGSPFTALYALRP
ncbi:methyltransferase domain-containing protein [Streptomyces sp. NPDC049555]|uniref:methyltransferase domain-containing protein n=1 Tax=Streptomyces sp. NPDC049555 TaxID=3154930 RepID=UPI0034380AC1